MKPVTILHLLRIHIGGKMCMSELTNGALDKKYVQHCNRCCMFFQGDKMFLSTTRVNSFSNAYYPLV